MTKIRLGGLKLWDGAAQVALPFGCEKHRLAATVSGPLAAERINIALLTHVAAGGDPLCGTALCVTRALGASCSSLLKAPGGEVEGLLLHTDVSIVSVFPHDQRLDIFGSLLRAMAEAGVEVRGLATSPSTIVSVLPDPAISRAVERLFGCFSFPNYETCAEWQARSRRSEPPTREIMASYEEKVIRIYGIVEETDLDLWSLLVPPPSLADLGRAMESLARFGLKLPFLVALPGPAGRLLFAFCMNALAGEEVERILSTHLPGSGVRRRGRVAALFLHGPHFGDRYGIANALIQTLKQSDTEILALGCAVSSISVVIDAKDIPTATRALETAFSIPMARE
jgi:aspartokinase